MSVITPNQKRARHPRSVMCLSLSAAVLSELDDIAVVHGEARHHIAKCLFLAGLDAYRKEKVGGGR